MIHYCHPVIFAFPILNFTQRKPVFWWGERRASFLHVHVFVSPTCLLLPNFAPSDKVKFTISPENIVHTYERKPRGKWGGPRIRDFSFNSNYHFFLFLSLAG